MLRSCAYLICVFVCAAAFAEVARAASEAGATAQDAKTEFTSAYHAFQDLSRAGKYFDALPYAEQSYRLGAQIYGPEDKNTAALAMNLAHTQLSAARRADALATYDIAIGLYEQSYGKNAMEVIEPLMSRAAASDVNTAGTYYDRAIKIARGQSTRDELRIAELNLTAGLSLQQRGGLYASGDYLDESYTDYKRLFQPNDLRFGTAAFWLGRYYLFSAKPAKSVPYLTEAATAFEASEGTTARQGAIAAHAMLVNAYSQLGDSDKATYHCVASGSLGSFGGKDVIPLYRVNPFYPGAARARHDEGWVQIKFTIDASGAVRDPTIIDIEGNKSFGEAGLAALKQWRYAPRFVDGKPADTEGIEVVLRFELEQ